MNNASIGSVVESGIGRNIGSDIENAESMDSILFIELFPYIVFGFLVEYQI